MRLKYIKIPISDKQIIEAAVRSVKGGAYKGSFLRGEGSLVGNLAESVFQEFMPESMNISENPNHEDRYDYDFVLKGKRIDVKSRTIISYLGPNLEFIIDQQKKDQKVDYYVFIGISDLLREAYIFGYLPHEDVKKCPVLNPGDPLGFGMAAKKGGIKILMKDVVLFGGTITRRD